MIQELRPEDFEIEYRSRNRFRFMGNGEDVPSVLKNVGADVSQVSRSWSWMRMLIWLSMSRREFMAV